MFKIGIVSNHDLITNGVHVFTSLSIFTLVVLHDKALLPFSNVIPVGFERDWKEGVTGIGTLLEQPLLSAAFATITLLTRRRHHIVGGGCNNRLEAVGCRRVFFWRLQASLLSAVIVDPFFSCCSALPSSSTPLRL